MQKLILLLTFSCAFYIAEGAFTQDTTFPSYKTFSALSKKEITRQFGKDEASKKIIKDHYRDQHRGWIWIIPAILFNGGGIYFFTLSAKATNGMGSVVTLVLGLVLLLPGLLFLFNFLRDFLFRKKPSKEILYNKLKEYYRGQTI